jgi:hypothetical protein
VAATSEEKLSESSSSLEKPTTQVENNIETIPKIKKSTKSLKKATKSSELTSQESPKETKEISVQSPSPKTEEKLPISTDSFSISNKTVVSSKIDVVSPNSTLPVAKTEITQIPPQNNVSTTSVTEKPKESQMIGTKDTEANILDRIPSFPRYLVDRMSKDAQKWITVGVLEIERIPTDKLERAVEQLSSARILYDEHYENEREIIVFLDAKIKKMNKCLEAHHEKEGLEKIQKIIIEPLDKGKFDKITRKLKEGSSIESVAYDVLDKIGRDARKIPLSEFALRKKIEEILRARFDKKP